MTDTILTSAETLSRAIATTRLSLRQFAAFINRNPRNIYRWLQGKPMSRVALERCQQILTTESEALRREVEAWIVAEHYRRSEKGRAKQPRP